MRCISFYIYIFIFWFWKIEINTVDIKDAEEFSTRDKSSLVLRSANPISDLAH